MWVSLTTMSGFASIDGCDVTSTTKKNSGIEGFNFTASPWLCLWGQPTRIVTAHELLVHDAISLVFTALKALDHTTLAHKISAALSVSVKVMNIVAYSPACCCAGASVTFATDKTAQKVVDLQRPVLETPPALDELQAFIFRPLVTKIPVADSFYNALVAQNDSLKAIVEPVSLSGADVLASHVVHALTSEFESGNEITIAGKNLRACVETGQQQHNANKSAPTEWSWCIAGKVDDLLYNIWACISKYDMDNKLSLSRKRNRGGESATLKGKRPDLCITTSRALLFKGEDTAVETHLPKAIHELGSKVSKKKDSYHGKV